MVVPPPQSPRTQRKMRAITIADDVFQQAEQLGKQEKKQLQNEKYLEFYREKFQEIKQLFPGKMHNDITKMVSKMWKRDKVKHQADTRTTKNDNKLVQKQLMKDEKAPMQPFAPQETFEHLESSVFQFVVEDQYKLKVLGSQILEGLRAHQNSLLIELEVPATDLAPFSRAKEFDKRVTSYILSGIKEIIDDQVPKQKEERFQPIKEEVEVDPVQAPDVPPPIEEIQQELPKPQREVSWEEFLTSSLFASPKPSQTPQPPEPSDESEVSYSLLMELLEQQYQSAESSVSDY